MTCHLSGAEHSSQWNEKHFAHRVRTLVTMTFQVNNQNTEVGSTEIERQVAACFCTTRTNSSLKRHATTRTRASHSRLALTTSTSHKSDRTTTLRRLYVFHLRLVNHPLTGQSWSILCELWPFTFSPQNCFLCRLLISAKHLAFCFEQLRQKPTDFKLIFVNILGNFDSKC